MSNQLSDLKKKKHSKNHSLTMTLLLSNHSMKIIRAYSQFNSQKFYEKATIIVVSQTQKPKVSKLFKVTWFINGGAKIHPRPFVFVLVLLTTTAQCLSNIIYLFTLKWNYWGIYHIMFGTKNMTEM